MFLPGSRADYTPRAGAVVIAGARGGLVAVLGGGLGFGLLLVLVVTGWRPLIRFDRQVAGQLTDWVAGSPTLASSLQLITTLGDPLLVTVVLALTLGRLLLRRRLGPAGWVLVTGIGAVILVPVVKALVARARPLAGDSLFTAEGAAFPSGHALGSLVGYGVLLLVVTPAVSRRAGSGLSVGVGLVVVAVGFTRVALGVHFVSDVLAGWLLGAAWLGVTTAAFTRWADRRVPAN